MRTKSDNGVISVRAISGTRVVILGFDLKGYQLPMVANSRLNGLYRTKVKQSSSMFIGFSVTRTDVESDIAVSLNEDDKPIQKFLWGDYEVEPGKEYEYTIHQLTIGRRCRSFSSKSVGFGSSLKVRITTEDPSKGTHGIFFNRGVASCHAYYAKFGEYRKWHLVPRCGTPSWRQVINPREISDFDKSKEALRWLSRGLEEALLEFINQATGNDFAIRAAVYEFTHKETLQSLADTVERGVDVKIIRHCKGVYHRGERGAIKWVPDSTTDEAERAIRSVGFHSLGYAKKWHHDTFIERKHSSALMHNKFIVLLKAGVPTQVWTGSTNFTDSGIYGQSNVGHIIRDIRIAGHYLRYWNVLSLDPPGRSNNTINKDREIHPEIVFETVNREEPLFLEPLGSIDDEQSEFNGALNLQSMKIGTCKNAIDDVIEKEQPDLVGPIDSGLTVIFSPRKTSYMLQFYADRMRDATNSVHLTAPFGVSQPFGQVLNKTKSRLLENTGSQDELRRSLRVAKSASSRNGSAVQPDSSNQDTLLRYVLFDKKPSQKASMKSKNSAAKKGKSYVDYFDFKNIRENRIAYGVILSDEEGEDSHEDLTGLTTFVDFIHLKCLLIDVTTDQPTVISGSANFSDTSTVKNDENMLIIHGDCAVADVYFTEYMRLFNHFYSRDNHKKKTFGWGQLVGDESWLHPYFDPTNQLYHERLLLR